MAILEKGHYHCIECGSLFEASIRSLHEQRCPVCGNPPTGKILAGTELDKGVAPVVRATDSKAQPARELHGENQDAQKIYEATLEAEKNKRRGRVKRTKRREKKSTKIWIMIGSWMLLMGLLVVLVNAFNSEEDKGSEITEIDAERTRIQAEAEAQEKKRIITAALPLCKKTISSFLNAPSVAGKAQYVLEGAKLSGVMSRYYQNNPSFSSARSKINIAYAELLDIPGRRSMGTICQNNLGEKFEVIFVYENKEWKIDWRALVRYDSQPWSLFPSSEDGTEGEFRLYMRVRNMDEDLESKEMSVVFYKPTTYVKNDFRGLASKSVRIVIDSPMGQSIQEMLSSEDDLKRGPFGLNVSKFDPLSYHRVRVRLRLNKAEGEDPQLEIIELLANHWYGQDLGIPEKSPSEN